MERRTAGEFDQELLNLFDQYVHGDIDRRGFLERAAKFAVGGMTAAMLLDALSPRFAEAQLVPRDDKRLRAQWLDYESPQGTGRVPRLSRPAGDGGAEAPGGARRAREPRPQPAHRGHRAAPGPRQLPRAWRPTPSRRWGGYPGDEDKAREAFAKLDQTKTREDFVAAAGVLKSRPDCTGKIGVVGFCYGGAIANMLATRIPDLAAAVPFYGTQPAAAEVAEDQGAAPHPLRRERRPGERGLARLRGRAEGEQCAVHGVHVPGTQHGFNNDTTPRYDRAAATLAWQRTIEFLSKNLRVSG